MICASCGQPIASGDIHDALERLKAGVDAQPKQFVMSPIEAAEIYAQIRAIQGERDRLEVEVRRLSIENGRLQHDYDAEKELRAEATSELKKALSEIQGSLHVINYYASHVRRWIKDPNVDVEGSCKAIEEYRGKIHIAITKVLHGEGWKPDALGDLFPPTREEGSGI